MDTDCLSINPDWAEIVLQGVSSDSWGVTTERVPAAPGSIARKGVVWYVATVTGAVWVTSSDPTKPHEDGLILPFNDTARAESDQGVDAAPDAPVYSGLRHPREASERALECMRGGPQ